LRLFLVAIRARLHQPVSAQSSLSTDDQQSVYYEVGAIFAIDEEERIFHEFWQSAHTGKAASNVVSNASPPKIAGRGI
jgi:hypothetical protein